MFLKSILNQITLEIIIESDENTPSTSESCSWNA